MFSRETLLFPTGGRSHYRIPSIVATNDGTILAFCNDRRDTVIDHASETMLVYARRLPGQDWEAVRALDNIPGWSCMIGSAVYDRQTDTVFVSDGRRIARSEWKHYTAEEAAALAAEDDEKARRLGIIRGGVLFRSADGGETWSEAPLKITPRDFVTQDGRTLAITGSCHGSAVGTQLRHGAHAGRLLCPSRIFTDTYDTWEDAIPCCYNNSIYSDDHGATWFASAPVQQGTGEGTLFEGPDGTIHYNSRGMYRDQKRYLATSTDSGETYHDFRTSDFLYEEKSIGCNASVLCVECGDIRGLPGQAESVTIFGNPRAEDRSNMTLCYSFDEGRTWSGTKSVWKGGSAYSSLTFDATTQRFFLLYEKGATSRDPYEAGVAVMEFDLEWLLAGYET